MHPIGTGESSSNRAGVGGAAPGEARPPLIGVDGGVGWRSEAEALLASSDKHFHDDRASSSASTVLPTVWHPSLEKHWSAADEGGAELMRAAFGTPAKPAPLRIAGPPSTAGEPSAERQPPSPRALDQDPQARFQASMVMVLIVFVVLLASAFTPLIR